MTTMIYQLKNGVRISGEPDQIVAVARAMGETPKLYKSSRQGYISVDDMSTPHIRNAILKTLRETPVDSTLDMLIREYFARVATP